MGSRRREALSPRTPKSRLEPLDVDLFSLDALSKDDDFLETPPKKKEDDMKKHQLEIREMETAFELFDAAGKGYITRADIRKVFCCLGETLSDPEIETILNEGDLEGKGYIDFRDFQRLMNAP